MHRKFLWRAAVSVGALLWFAPNTLMAQSNQTDATRWLAKADIAPPFAVAASKSAFETQRRQVRAQLWESLGKLPPRPKRPTVVTLSTEERAGCVAEKFQFDNGAGAAVPGYLLRPKELRAKAPAILYCHWHGGEYDIGKEELFQARHTPEPPGPALVKRGFAVLGIDAYCFGERNGQGPGGASEKGREEEMSASKFNLWVGRTIWGMMLRDDLMALDYLASRPEVDARRLGVTGMSMGAHAPGGSWPWTNGSGPAWLSPARHATRTLSSMEHSRSTAFITSCRGC